MYSFKKRINACMLVLMITFLVCNAVSGHAEASNTKMQELACQYTQDKLGYAKEKLQEYSFVKTEKGTWAFSLRIKDADPTTNGLVIGELSENGKLLTLEGPKPVSLYTQLLEAMVRAQRDYREVYKIKQTWLPRLNSMSPQDAKEFERHRQNIDFVAFIQHDIRLPGAGDISYQSAKSKAEGAILALSGWNQEMLSLLRIDLEVFHVPKDFIKPVYQFVYSLASFVRSTEAAIAGDHTFNFSEAFAQEKLVFGKMLPMYVSVRIDTQTGEIRGPVEVEAAPVTPGGSYKFILK